MTDESSGLALGKGEAREEVPVAGSEPPPDDERLFHEAVKSLRFRNSGITAGDSGTIPRAHVVPLDAELAEIFREQRKKVKKSESNKAENRRAYDPEHEDTGSPVEPETSDGQLTIKSVIWVLLVVAFTLAATLIVETL